MDQPMLRALRRRLEEIAARLATLRDRTERDYAAQYELTDLHNDLMDVIEEIDATLDAENGDGTK